MGRGHEPRRRTDSGTELNGGATIMHHSGFDIDAIAGYDFGMVRLEGEISYKQASVNQLELDSRLSGAGPLSNFDADGKGRALSAMVNFLLDFGNEDGLSGYAGPGIGIAEREGQIRPRVTPNGVVGFSDSDSGLRGRQLPAFAMRSARTSTSA